MDAYFKKIKKQIMQDPLNQSYTDRGIEPLFTASQKSRVIIIGQAPGKKAEEAGMPWHDASGDTLRKWIGVDRETFYDDKYIALLPMDFYFPGKGKSGDLAPRKEFAEKWHKSIMKKFDDDVLILVVGQYAQKKYLPKDMRYDSLTDNVRHYKDFKAYNIFPLPHPSPRNNIWQSKNKWFKKKVLPVLKQKVTKKLSD